MCILLISIAAMTAFRANSWRIKAAVDERLMKGVSGDLRSKSLLRVPFPRPAGPDCHEDESRCSFRRLSALTESTPLPILRPINPQRTSPAAKGKTLPEFWRRLRVVRLIILSSELGATILGISALARTSR